VGTEQPVDEVASVLRGVAQAFRPGAVGAMHLTCADESEHECADAFQQRFVRYLLPRLKFAHRAPFRIANLGARYEPGAARLVEAHYATPESAASFKLVVLKINAHVSKDADLRYGEMQRYQVPSHYCGALRALLDGAASPCIDALRTVFCADGFDRVAALREKVETAVRPLAAAIVNARLQAKLAYEDTLTFEPATPTVYLIVPCVTLNEPDRDAELTCGYYVADRREGSTVEYVGLGDDPTRYVIRHDASLLRVADDQLNPGCAAS